MKKNLIFAGLIAASSIALAQDSNGGWRRVGDTQPPPVDQAQPDDPNYNGSAPQRPPFDAQRPPYDPRQGDPNFGPQNYPPQNYPPQNSQNYSPPPNYGPPPAQLTIRPGTVLTVRINQRLSSDHNQQGDAFTATLIQPVVVDGIVVAQNGQTLNGRVAEAKKAGRVEGTSRLGLELTELTAVDGQVLPVNAQVINRNGRTSEGRDVAAVAGTTALGAALGAAAGWGTGAAIGAGAGAGAGIIGVLLTRGQPTIIGPESVLSFRIDQPITISTERAPQAFRVVDSSDYGRAGLQSRSGPPPQPRPALGPYYGGGYGYPYPYYGPYYGSGVSIFYGGGRFYGGRRGFRR